VPLQRNLPTSLLANAINQQESEKDQNERRTCPVRCFTTEVQGTTAGKVGFVAMDSFSLRDVFV
jgi:hypothetical protein